LASGEGLASVFEKLRTPPEQSMAFAIAVIALSAKMAKADGQVTRDEVTAFREVFVIAPEDEANAARVFDLARQDVAGFEQYAGQINRLFADRHETLCDLVEGLFYIAIADGTYHPKEDVFLEQVSRIFGITEREFKTLRARFVPEAEQDPWAVLGVEPDAPMEIVRAAWRRAVRESHPDQLVARGVPEEAMKMAERRMVAINHAWEEISRREGVS
jgi:DnaJ like chaperone protein